MSNLNGRLIWVNLPYTVPEGHRAELIAINTETGRMGVVLHPR